MSLLIPATGLRSDATATPANTPALAVALKTHEMKIDREAPPMNEQELLREMRRMSL